MSAKNLSFEKTIAETSGGQLAVRGLSTADIGMLASRYPEAIRAAFNYLNGTNKDGADPMELITGFPNLVSDVIGVATGDFGDEEGMAAVQRIPIPDQVAILTKIGEATFKTTDEVKKFIAVALGAIQGAREVVPVAI